MVVEMISAIAFFFGYALGSVPFGLLLTKLAGLGDIRAIGSGNIGATNVLRTGRKDIAILTLLFDALKGTAAILIAKQWGVDAAILAALGAFLGHLFPVWLKFKGGKGVATYIGLLLGLMPLAAVVFCATWLLMAFLFRFSSLAAITAAVATPFFLRYVGEMQTAELMMVCSFLLVIKHQENIRRLLKGEESKIKL
jgi:acyl phosphate:glycerol-3-phosphate acyltransferase